MRRKPALFDETKKIAIAIVSDPWEIIETRPWGYPRNVYSYPRIVYMTVLYAWNQEGIRQKNIEGAKK